MQSKKQELAPMGRSCGVLFRATASRRVLALTDRCLQSPGFLRTIDPTGTKVRIRELILGGLPLPVGAHAGPVVAETEAARHPRRNGPPADPRARRRAAPAGCIGKARVIDPVSGGPVIRHAHHKGHSMHCVRFTELSRASCRATQPHGREPASYNCPSQRAHSSMVRAEDS